MLFSFFLSSISSKNHWIIDVNANKILGLGTKVPKHQEKVLFLCLWYTEHAHRASHTEKQKRLSNKRLE